MNKCAKFQHLAWTTYIVMMVACATYLLGLFVWGFFLQTNQAIKADTPLFMLGSMIACVAFLVAGNHIESQAQ